MRFVPLFFCVFIFSTAFSQRGEIDSLKKVLANPGADSLKVEAMNLLFKKYINESIDTALSYANQAMTLAESSNYKHGVAVAQKNLGLISVLKGDYIGAINNYQKALEAFKSIKEDSMAAVVTGNLGAVYFDRGDDVKSLEYHLMALKSGEDRHDTNRIAVSCSNIGAVYSNKDATLDMALIYYLRALELSPSIHFADTNITKATVATIAVNIGEIYYKKKTNPKDTATEAKNLDSAQYYFNKAIAISKGTVDAPYALNKLGIVYMKKHEYDMAIKVQQEAYEVAKSYDTRNDMAITLLGLADSYKAKGDYKTGLKTYKQAEALAMETGSAYSLKDIYNGLAQVYSELHDYGNAFKYQGLLIAIKDTIYNQETDKKLGTIQFTFDLQKKESEINLLTKDKEIQDQVINRQRIVRNSFMGAFATMVVFATVFFRQRNRISKEKKRSDELLLNILPEETAEELKATGTAKTKSFDSVSVLFTDFKNFTQASEKLTPEELVAEINHCYSEFDKIITRHGIEKIKTIGDAYMCAGGLPVANATHPFDVVAAGLEMVDFIERNKQERIAKDQPFFELRLGIHTGPVVAGIVGIKKFAYDIWGDTVNTASRMESSGEIGKVNVSGATYELVKGKFHCVHRGKVKAKNKGEIDMYFVEGKV